MDTVVRRILVILTAIAVILTGAVVAQPANAADPGYFDETYRPQYHYTAEKNMINDPNGLVYLDGEYHLFHQYNLHDAVHWGHSVSTDLVHWTRLEPALFPDSIGQIFSGSVVVDTNNTSGFQTGANKVLVAAFTYGEHNQGPQSQGIAYSNDKGRTWTMYSGNPVMPNTGQPDFRDPKIFWHAGTSKWIMVLTVGKTLDFYTSTNLKTWTFASNWGTTETHNGNWECPDLFPMVVAGTSTTKWVLSVSQDQDAPSGGVGMRYFVGSFNGTTFTPDSAGAAPLWQNYGKDYYAGVTWNDIPAADGRRMMIAWSDNWQYRFDPPTQPFNGQLSIIRELQLKSFSGSLRLVQNPVTEYNTLRGTPQTWTNQTITPSTNLLSAVAGDAIEIVARFNVTSSTATSFGIAVRKGPTQSTPVGYNKTTSTMYVDRTNSGVVPNPSGTSPNGNWSGIHSAPLAPDSGKVTLRIFVDRSSVEVFGNDGREQISDLILPDRTSLGLQTFAVGGNATLESLTVYPLARIWPTSSPITSNIGGWTSVTGEWADTKNGREGSATGTGLSLGSASASDFTLTSQVKIQGVLAGNPKPIKQEAAVGYVFRSDDKGKNGYLALLNAKTDKVTLARLEDGNVTVLASGNRTLATNTNYTLALTATGTSLSVSVNGTVAATATDSQYRDGLVGLAVQDSAAFVQSISLTPTTKFVTNLRNWAGQSGTWTWTSTGLRGASATDGIALSTEVASDFEYESDITVAATGGQRAGTLVFRANDNASQGYGLNVDAGTDVVTFFRWGSPGATIATIPTTINTGTVYRLKVRAVGNAFTFFLNGTQIGTATDGTLSQGRLGVDVYNSTATFQNTTVNRIPASWSTAAGTWTTVTGGWQGSSAGDGFLVSSESAANGTYRATVRVSGTTGGKAAAALMFRANVAGTEGYVANIDALNDFVTLFKFNPGGGSTVLGRYAYSIDAGRDYKLEVRADDNQLEVYLDGRLAVSVLDSTYTSGRLALNVWNSQSTFTGIGFAPDDNLVFNSGFEYGNLTGWTEWHPGGQSAAFGVDGNDVYQGSSKLYFFSGSAYQESVHQVLTGVPNGSYVAKAWVKLSQPATIARMEIGANGAPVDVNISSGATYQMISTPVTVTTGQIDLGFYISAPGNTSLQIDAISITKA